MTLRQSLSSGELRSAITIFAPATVASMPPTFESAQIFRYAGYMLNDGAVDSKLSCFVNPLLFVVEEPMHGVVRQGDVAKEMVRASSDGEGRRARSIVEVVEAAIHSDASKSKVVVDGSCVFT